MCLPRNEHTDRWLWEGWWKRLGAVRPKGGRHWPDLSGRTGRRFFAQKRRGRGVRAGGVKGPSWVAATC